MQAFGPPYLALFARSSQEPMSPLACDIDRSEWEVAWEGLRCTGTLFRALGTCSERSACSERSEHCSEHLGGYLPLHSVYETSRTSLQVLRHFLSLAF